MTNEHINRLAEYLVEQSKFFENYDYVSVSITRPELDHILKHLHDHREPTYEEVMDYCKARHLYLMNYMNFEERTNGLTIQKMVDVEINKILTTIKTAINLEKHAARGQLKGTTNDLTDGLDKALEIIDSHMKGEHDV